MFGFWNYLRVSDQRQFLACSCESEVVRRKLTLVMEIQRFSLENKTYENGSQPHS